MLSTVFAHINEFCGFLNASECCFYYGCRCTNKGDYRTVGSVPGINIPNNVDLASGGLRFGGDHNLELSGIIDTNGASRTIGHHGLDPMRVLRIRRAGADAAREALASRNRPVPRTPDIPILMDEIGTDLLRIYQQADADTGFLSALFIRLRTDAKHVSTLATHIETMARRQARRQAPQRIEQDATSNGGRRNIWQHASLNRPRAISGGANPRPQRRRRLVEEEGVDEQDTIEGER